MTARHPDAIGAAAIAAVAVATLAGALTIQDPGFGVVPPAAFPLALAVLMLVSAVWLLIDTLRQRSALVLEPLDRRPLVATAAATAAFLALFIPLGFVVSATAFLVAEARILGSRAIVRDAVASFIFVLAMYWLFVGFLTVDLPSGPLPF